MGVGDFPADVENKKVQSRRRVNPPLYLEVFDRLLHGGGQFGDMVGDAGEVVHHAGGDGRGELVDALDDGRELVYRVGRFAATVLDAADQM